MLAASGGHATTPETAAALIRQLRDDLDRAKGREKGLREALEKAGRTLDGIATATSSIPAFMPLLEEIAAALAQETK